MKNLVQIMALMIAVVACAQPPPVYNGASSSALLANATFEVEFARVLEQLEKEPSREEIASILYNSQLALNPSASKILGNQVETGRCLITGPVALPEIGKNSSLRANPNKAVLFSEPGQKSEDCLKLFKSQLGEFWNVNGSAMFVSFFSYTR